MVLSWPSLEFFSVFPLHAGIMWILPQDLASFSRLTSYHLSSPSLCSSLLDHECRLLPPASGPLHALVLRSSMPLLLSTWLNSTDPQHSAFFSIKEAFLKHVYLPESPPTPFTPLFLLNSVSPIVLRAPRGIWPLHHLCDHSTNREVDA